MSGEDRVAQLLGLEVGASEEALRGGAEAKIAALGLERPALFDTSDVGEEDPRELLWWLLRMAPASGRAPAAPTGEDATHVKTLRALLQTRPAADATYLQMPVDPASTLARARQVAAHLAERPGPVVAVGDDDATTLALALLGVKEELHVVDLDPRLRAWLEAAGRELGATIHTHAVDVFEDAAPAALVGRCAAAITDPIRSFEATLAFLELGAACLGDAGRLFWADHPDWNLELEVVLRALGDRGLVLERVEEALHRYPLEERMFPDLEGKAAALGVDARWLRELVASVSGWTHLYVLGASPER
ncbi:MAG TPA: bis-aminopropyl spermidine synthase family protein [Polyangiaceae bacterium LLY-WYZ-15_(1-7)]|nr:bis-aminopropyl spermidine synthase family protein [Polyangiaceae bacterium LLY-WYZ-15_(1-7)]HJL10918.1 bis-aminopropyl spermidine synthase family protein [Polyangiaceae bacterium LLY-WYZ-15_(1-7)]HJL27040.1 bis-aminopropyl spermidine synthase family protein [Polyangiaceae bacterium LLY-WYZ-15_(1-7)]HJL49603.1 bis-aminopropyl spermidine synthase family protein [Polyangiaceae bacterium LLY-WYZ-15_(1-7)]